MAASKILLRHKGAFFNAVAQDGKNGLIIAAKRANHTQKDYVAQNLLDIEEDLNQFYGSLANKNKHKDRVWLYCFYSAIILENHYKTTIPVDKDKTTKYSAIRKEMDKHFNTKSHFELDQLAKDFIDFLSTPFHSAKISSVAGVANIWRLKLAFMRLVIQTSILFAKESEFLSKLFGGHAGFDQMLETLGKPTGLFNAFSVGFFGVRLLMNIGEIIKDTIKPVNRADKDWYARLSKAFWDRHIVMANDIVWATVNGVTNYAKYFNISAPVANWTMAAFLIFDISLLFYRRRLKEEEYLLKVAEKEAAKNKAMDNPELFAKLDNELQALRMEATIIDSTIWFNITAGTLILSGFSAALLLGTPAALPVTFVVCCLAIAMYASESAYSKFKEKSLRLEQEESSANDKSQDPLAIELAKSEKKEALSDLGLAVAKNTVVPMLIMGTFAVSWPAAVLLTLAYMGYEATKGYFKSEQKSAPSVGPASDDDLFELPVLFDDLPVLH